MLLNTQLQLLQIVLQLWLARLEAQLQDSRKICGDGSKHLNSQEHCLMLL